MRHRSEVCSWWCQSRHKWRQYLLSIVYKLQSSPPPTKVQRAVNSNYHERPTTPAPANIAPCSVPPALAPAPASIRKSDVCQVWNFNSIEMNSRSLKWSSLSEFPDTWYQIPDCGWESQTIVTPACSTVSHSPSPMSRCHGHKCPVIRAQTLSWESATLHSQFERNPVETHVIQANICFTTDVNSIQFSVNSTLYT